MDFAVFADAFADSAPGELDTLIKRAVPAPEDRLDLDRLDRPMELREYIETDLSRRADPEYSADLGAFMALLSVIGQLPALLQKGRLDAASQLSDLDGWFLGFFSMVDTVTGDRLLAGRMLDGEGRPHRRRFALGPHTSARSAAAFTRPRTNALPCRQNDVVAREILRLIAESEPRTL
jgi:hypothetical protein